MDLGYQKSVTEEQFQQTYKSLKTIIDDNEEYEDEEPSDLNDNRLINEMTM